MPKKQTQQQKIERLRAETKALELILFNTLNALARSGAGLGRPQIYDGPAESAVDG
jgi:hypothetical protein